MYYGEIKNCDIANGVGVRVSILYRAAEICARTVSNPRHGILSTESHLQKIQRSIFWDC